MPAPFIFKTHGRKNSGFEDEITRISNIADAGYQLALDLDDAGFQNEYLIPYTIYETNTDIEGFFGLHAFEGFWAVEPPEYLGYPTDGRQVPLVVDTVPAGYVPNPPYFIGAVLGTIDKVKAHKAIMEIISGQLNDFYGPAGYTPKVIFQDFEATFPVTYMAIEPTFNWKPNRSKVLNNAPTSIPRNALFTNGGGLTALGNAGYSCSGAGSIVNITQDLRDNTRYLQLCLSTDFLSQPLIDKIVGQDRTVMIPFRLDSTDWIIAAAPDRCSLASTGNAAAGAGDLHLDMAILEIPTAGNSNAAFATFGSDNDESSFRKGPQADGVSIISINHDGLFLDGTDRFQSPRIVTLWGGDQNSPTQWENGLGQMTEPWIGFSLDGTQPASVIGKLPGAMVVHKYMDDGDPFIWDRVTDNFTGTTANRAWKIYTVQRGAQAGTLMFLYPATPGDPVIEGDCP